MGNIDDDMGFWTCPYSPLSAEPMADSRLDLFSKRTRTNETEKTEKTKTTTRRSLAVITPHHQQSFRQMPMPIKMKMN